MNRPLYRNAVDTRKPAAEFHRGLWFERFVDFYEVKDGVWKIPKPKDKANPKGEWIRQVAGQCGNKTELTRHALGLVQRLGFLGGEYRGFETDWHFATGLGNPHPVENGFLWHPTLGVPYLPGAAVKGLVRAWVEQWDESLDEPSCERRVADWFGVDPEMAKKDGIPERAGCLIFFDALPVKQVELALDVMTPHYGKWYEQGGELEAKSERDLYSEENAKRIPADWHDPVPVPFLVAKNASFIFAIAPRRPEFKDEVRPALDALKKALECLGAGAKTAVGYGRMVEAPLDLFRSAWVDKTIQEIKERNRCSEDEALRGKPLAEAWQSLTDEPKKLAALRDIQKRWQEKGWWEIPPGKAAKAAKQIYAG
jgi:CRISPR-associated protein Cmr6